MLRNDVRTQWNNKAAIHKTAKMQQALMIHIAQDKCNNKSIEDRRLVATWLESCDSKSEHLPGLLPLASRMPVILTQNERMTLQLFFTETFAYRLTYKTSTGCFQILLFILDNKCD